MPSKNNTREPVSSKLIPIKMIILDVDGVLTDGRIIIGSDGTDYKNFHAHDGYGITRALAAGLRLTVISGRKSEVTSHRMKKLGIREFYQNKMDKVKVYRMLKKKYRLHDREACFIGDDEFDLPLLNIVGFSAAPCDAMPAVLKGVDFVSSKKGGRGAVREVIDCILHAKKIL